MESLEASSRSDDDYSMDELLPKIRDQIPGEVSDRSASLRESFAVLMESLMFSIISIGGVPLDFTYS